MSIKIIGTGSYVPEKVLTNFDLEKMVDTNDEWISTRTGIRERHIASPEQATSDLALNAAKMALANANTDPSELDIILVATVTPDHFFPSTGCILQRLLGAENAFCFDIEAACSGLLYSLETAHALLKANKKYRKALVLGAEKLSAFVNWEDRNTCVLFGDGASAVVLSKDDDDAPDTLVASDIHSDGRYTDILAVPAGGSRNPASPDTVNARQHSITMAGKEVFKLAVNGMVSSCSKVLSDANVSPSDVAWLIPHQANYRILSAVAQRVEIADEKVFVNIDRYGNTSSASIGICLNELISSGRVKRGDYLLLTAFGGGLTWGAQLFKY